MLFFYKCLPKAIEYIIWISYGFCIHLNLIFKILSAYEICLTYCNQNLLSRKFGGIIESFWFFDNYSLPKSNLKSSLYLHSAYKHASLKAFLLE